MKKQYTRMKMNEFGQYFDENDRSKSILKSFNVNDIDKLKALEKVEVDDLFDESGVPVQEDMSEDGSKAEDNDS